MVNRSLSIALILVFSWFLEFLRIRYDVVLDVRIGGIHCIPLFLLPLVAAWIALPKGTNIIGILGRVGVLRWWLTAILVPILCALGAAAIILFAGYARISDDAKVVTRLLTLFVDLPLNFVVWFLVIAPLEFFWRGIVGASSGRLISALIWSFSLAGLGFAGIGGKGFSFFPGIMVLASLFVVGWYQSIVYHRSGSLLVACMSLLTIALASSILQTLPFSDIDSILVYNLRRFPGHPVGILIASVLLIPAGILMGSFGRRAPANR